MNDPEPQIQQAIEEKMRLEEEMAALEAAIEKLQNEMPFLLLRLEELQKWQSGGHISEARKEVRMLKEEIDGLDAKHAPQLESLCEQIAELEERLKQRSRK